MITSLPGTTVEAELTPQEAKKLIDNLFLSGGLMLSQVANLTGLEPYVIQNWVKRGFLSPPRKKIYSKDQFCRIALINMLRSSLQIEKIVELLSLVNGIPDDESDDVITDSDLYLLFIRFLCEGDKETESGKETYPDDTMIQPLLRQDCGATLIRRIRQIVHIMLCAYRSDFYQKKVLRLYAAVD